jgi:hypothetical protein
MADDDEKRDTKATKEELDSQSIALALKVTEVPETWGNQDRGVYTSEVMERELDKLFPVDQFIQKKKGRINLLTVAED